MSFNLSRRLFLATGLLTLGNATAAIAARGPVPQPLAEPTHTQVQYFDPSLLPPVESEIDYPIEPVRRSLICKTYRCGLSSLAQVRQGSIVVAASRRHIQ
jgi:hypothetical protein